MNSIKPPRPPRHTALDGVRAVGAALGLFSYESRGCRLYTWGLLPTLAYAHAFFYLESMGTWNMKPFTEKILENFEFLSLAAFNFSCVLGAVKNRGRQIEFFAGFRKIDGILKCREEESEVRRFLAKVVILHLVLLVMYYFMTWFKPVSPMTILYLAMTYPRYYFATSATYLDSLIEKRYDLLEKRVSVTFASSRITVIGARFEDKVLEATRLSYLLHECTRRANDIFGVSVLAFVVNTFGTTLCIFNYGLLLWDDGSAYVDAVPYLFNCLSLCMFAVPMVRGCDKIEKRFSKMLVSFNILQSKIEDTVLREELIVLINYVKDLRPRFTAAGLFDINQNLYSAFFSSLVSYLIIIVQFKTSDIG